MNTAAIKKLRKKFILVSVLSILIAMLFIGLMINFTNYSTSGALIRRVLTKIIENDGVMNYVEKKNDNALKEGTGMIDAFKPHFSRYMYYSCIFDEDNNIVKIIDEMTDNMQIDKSDIADYAKKALGENDISGRYGNYYYMKGRTKDGRQIVVFLDATMEISSMTRLFYWTLAVCIAGLLITFIFMLFLSKRVIQPEIENTRRQKQFITNASHELKTPLAVIRANVEMEEIMNGETEFSKSTIKQIDHMNGLIKNLVMIAKAEEKEDKSTMSDENITELVNDSVSSFDAMAKQEQLQLVKEIENDVHMVINGSKVRQLTTLLVDNAIKYCDENGVVRVRLTSIRKGKGIILKVSNTYAEGAKVDYRRFFDRFYREDQSHNIDRGGYGIGLSIAESICRQNNGSIRADWNNGEISFVCKLL